MRARPLGYSIGEVWGEFLTLSPGPGRDSAWWLGRHVIDWVRIMAKVEEYYEHPDRFEQLTLEKMAVAEDLGLKVLLCIDNHNIATKKGEYHLRRYSAPDPIRVVVKKILRETGLPWGLEVDNEAWYVKGRKGLTTLAYRDLVAEYAEGADDAGFKQRLWASQSGDKNPWRDGSKDWDHYWEKTVAWQHDCAEVRHSWVLDHRPTNPERFEEEILDSFHNPHRPPDKAWKGWEYAIAENEFSSTGKQVHCDSPLGFHMTRAATHAFRELRSPFGWLTMGGWQDEWPEPNHQGWGMSTHLTRSDGAFSQVAEALAADKGVELPDSPSPPPPGPDPDPDPSTPGMDELLTAQKKLAKAIDLWPTSKAQRRAEAAIGHIQNAIGEV